MIDQTWKKMMEDSVYEYVSKVDFKHPDFSLEILKEQLQELLGIKPSVKLKWNTTEKINELLRDSGVKDYKEIVEKMEQINIVFTDPNNNVVQMKFIL